MTAPSAQRMPPASLLFPWRSWVNHPQLRAWTTWVFVALVSVPPLALTVLASGSHSLGPTATAFAFYFAVAWALVLWVVVRPQRVDAAVLAIVAGVALVVEAPLALALEEALNADYENLILSVVTIGVPEELAKLLPVVALALVHRRAWTAMAPRDFLFLGAVSGLVFGAVEAARYAVAMNVSSSEEGLFLVWRLVTDPIVHACWAGVAGYFLGLASRYREPGPWLALAGIGLGVPAVLHGVNDWVGIGPAWILVALVSTLLFLAYARVGLVAATPRVPADPPTMRIPAVGSTGMPLTAAGARPTVGAWAPTPRSAPSPTWRP